MMQIDWFQHTQIKLRYLMFLVSLFSPFSSIAGDEILEKATYKAEENRLLVVVKRGEDHSNTTITLFDNVLNRVLTEKESSEEEIKFKIQPISGGQVPCVVRVEFDNYSSSKQVKNAPSDCSQVSYNLNPEPGQNSPPTCSIISPADDVTVGLGTSVNFVGSGTDPDGDSLSFEWDFAGGADSRPLVAAPGDIVFDRNNSLFNVKFIVTDSHGARCEDNVLVAIGEIPSGLPDKVSEEPAPGTPAAGDNQHVVLPYNDLGMHCGDLSSYPLSILPPFNTPHAQFIRKGSIGANKPVLLDISNYGLQYSAASNPYDPVGPGSINSTSQNYPPGSIQADAMVKKNDFWDPLDWDPTVDNDTIASALFDPAVFGDILPDTGLTGSTMPGISDPYRANIPQPFLAYDNDKHWFTALGIPMVGVDDSGRLNSYPLMRVQGADKLTGIVLATTDVVLPVSSEVDCRDCHTKGEIGADPVARPDIAFVDYASLDRIDVEQAAKKNIIALHNSKYNLAPKPQLLADGKPVLCASCHGSNALGTSSNPESLSNMSNAMHGHHGRFQLDPDQVGKKLLRDLTTGEPILFEVDPDSPSSPENPLIAFGADIPMEENCLLCHPGKITQCFRGAMFTAGQQCVDCHGDMLAVGGEFPLNDGHTRIPWVDEPRCESCHTGDGNETVLTKAYDLTDLAATPLPPVSQRFAETANTLYRDSLGHGGVGCEGCHGSPHAIWPNQDPNANDNVTAKQLQGHKGSIQECTVCHEENSFPDGTLGGPHGMHPVNDPTWIKSKGDMYHEDYVEDEQGNDQCAVCHGADHKGTRLSKVPVDRVLKDADGVVRATLSAGDIVSCDLCHSLEKSFDN